MIHAIDIINKHAKEDSEINSMKRWAIIAAFNKYCNLTKVELEEIKVDENSVENLVLKELINDRTLSLLSDEEYIKLTIHKDSYEPIVESNVADIYSFMDKYLRSIFKDMNVKVESYDFSSIDLPDEIKLSVYYNGESYRFEGNVDEVLGYTFITAIYIYMIHEGAGESPGRKLDA